MHNFTTTLQNKPKNNIILGVKGTVEKPFKKSRKQGYERNFSGFGEF